MVREFHYDVFLSHSSKDKAIVRAVAERLHADGLRVWLDDWEIRPGDSIPAKIEAALGATTLPRATVDAQRGSSPNHPECLEA